MNHSQARAPLPQKAALQAVLQFLRESGYLSSAEMLEEESETPYDQSALEASPSHLLTALTSYEDQRAMAFAVRQPDAELLHITQWMHSLRQSKEQPASRNCTSLQTHSANVICVKFQPGAGSDLYAAGSADKSVAICSVRNNSVLRRVQASGPVLSLHFNPVRPSLLLATCMNGGHSLIDVSRLGDDASNSESVVHSAVDHKKYVVTGKFNPAGTHYATGSHDNTVNVYGPGASPLEFAQLGSIDLSSPVESLEWVSASSFYVSVREDNYLHHVSIEDGQVKEVGRINVNETGDDHVSFNVLDMRLSPVGSCILLATDRHRVILLTLGGGSQVRNFYNVTNDGYSTPRLAWSPKGKYAYVTSQDRSVAILDIAAGKTIANIKGHEINVRDVAVQEGTGKVITCSFDKTCRITEPVPVESHADSASVAIAAPPQPAA